MNKTLSAVEQARANLKHAEQHLAVMTQERIHAEYREKNARALLEDAKKTLADHLEGACHQRL